MGKIKTQWKNQRQHINLAKSPTYMWSSSILSLNTFDAAKVETDIRHLLLIPAFCPGHWTHSITHSGHNMPSIPPSVSWIISFFLLYQDHFPHLLQTDRYISHLEKVNTPSLLPTPALFLCSPFTTKPLERIDCIYGLQSHPPFLTRRHHLTTPWK